MSSYFVYILASKTNGTLYIGVTNDILSRVQAHKDGIGSMFTSKYRVHNLVYLEEYAISARPFNAKLHSSAIRESGSLT